MKLPINVLLHELSDIVDEVVCLPFKNEKWKFSGTKLFDDSEHGLVKDDIYIVDEKDIDKIQDYMKKFENVPVTFLYITSDENFIDISIENDFQIIVFKTSRSMKMVFNSILRIFQEFQEWETSINLTVIQNGSIQQLADFTEKIIHYPFIIFDPSLNVLGFSRNINTKNNDYNFTVSLGYTPYQKFRETQKQKIDRMLLESDEPCVEISPVFSGKYNIHFHLGRVKQLYGYISIFDYPCNPKENGFYDLLELIEENLLLYYKCHNELLPNQDMFEAYIHNILTSDKIHMEQVVEQGKYIEDLKNASCFLLCKVMFERKERHELSYIRNFIKVNFSMYSFLYKNELYLLKINGDFTKKTELFTDYEEIKFKNLFKNHKFQCIISNEFYQIENLKSAILQCELIGNLDGYLEQKGRIYSHKDYFIFSILQSMNQEYLDFLVRSSDYFRLKKYDIENGTELCKIYYNYLIHSENMKQTANALYMHRNTLMNRLKKIENILEKNDLLHNSNNNNHVLDITYLISYEADRYLNSIE